MPMIEGDIRALALAKRIREVAFDDVVARFPNDDSESFSEWLAKFVKENPRPQWFKVITTNSDNAPELFSIDAQGRYVKQHGEEALVELLATQNLRPGETLKAPKPDASDTKGESNPWSKAFKGDDAEREARKASIIRSGTKFAASMAASAGVYISGAPLKK